MSLTETVESADNMDAYAMEGDNSSGNELEENGKSGNVTGTALQQKALNCCCFTLSFGWSIGH